MMILKGFKRVSGGRRVAEVKVQHETEEHWIVGEVHFFGDDSTIKFSHDMHTVFRYDNEEDADLAFNNFNATRELS